MPNPYDTKKLQRLTFAPEVTAVAKERNKGVNFSQLRDQGVKTDRLDIPDNTVEILTKGIWPDNVD